MYINIFKPLIDFTLSLIALIVFSPLFVIIYLVLWVGLKGNPLFFQVRPGYKAKPFKIIKFRTMTNERDANGELLPDEQRLTALGKFVRKTSLDEIPQLINVLKGDVSLIGPRPLIMSYIPLYSAEQARRHDVKPGITGWAQVNGRNAISWTRKFELDIEYVDNVSFLMDMRILFLTIKKVLVSDGINSDTHATMEAFTGNN
nr:sugar transferase [uncultured Carboxylicivirga sp.]